jgi:general secretion pathway protein B
MSIILDALKKLDREKSSRRNRTANIAAEILKPEAPRPGKRVLRYCAAAGLTAVATAAATYVLLQSGVFSKSSAPANPPTPTQQAAPGPGPREPLGDAQGEGTRIPLKSQDPGEGRGPGSPAPPSDRGTAEVKPVSPQVPPAPSFREPASGAGEGITPAPPKIQDRDESKKPGSPPPPPERSSLDLKAAGPQAPQTPVFREPTGDGRGEINRVPPKIRSESEDKKNIPSTPTLSQGPGGANPPSQQAPSSPVSREPVRGQVPGGSSPTPSAMKLSGIVWSSEPSERLAVINSMVVGEGATIEGVKVVEILPTSVRLLHNGKSYELSINLFGK